MQRPAFTGLWPLTALFAERAPAGGHPLPAYDADEIDAAFAALVTTRVAVPELRPADETAADVDALFARLTLAA